MYLTSLKPVQLPYVVRLLVVVSLVVTALGWEGLLRQSPFVPDVAFTSTTPSHSTKVAAVGADQPQTSAGNRLTMEDSASLPAALYAAWIAQQQAEGGVAYSLVKGQQEGASDWSGSNGAQGLHLEFEPGAVKINGWGIALNSASPPQVAGNRIEYQQASGLHEWYVNGPLGLEQGFTLTQPLPQTDQDGWLALTVPFEGARVQTQGHNKEWLGLVDANGQQVGRYGKLYATDANGKVLESQLGPSEDGKAAILRVKVAGASYPLVIDPFVQQASLTNADGAASDQFGASVALSSDGSTALIGAYQKNIGANTDQGAAYIFTRSGAGGSYSQSQRLTAADGVAYEEFGFSVALSSDGSTALIGAFNKTIGAYSQQGAAYIFTRSGAGGSYSQSQRLTNEDGAARDEFGFSVALSSDGSTALIGAFYKTNSQGAAYIFTRSGAGGSYSQSQRLTAADGAAGDQFGNSVALSSDGATALIGAFYKTIGANNVQGAAYIFTRSGAGGSYSQSQRLTNEDGATGDAFGASVALSSDSATALIGAYQKNIGVNYVQGAAYIFSVPTPRIAVSSGSPQNAPVNTAFTSPLVALVRDGNTNNPLPGLSVTFTAPGSGAGGTFADGSTVYTASTDASGLVTTTSFTANSVAGSYSVTATVVGASGGNSTSFSLTNLSLCTPLVVTSKLDDGSCGTLRAALVAASTGPTKTVMINLAAGSTITLTTGLTLSSGVAITTTAPCGIGAGNTMLPPVIIQGVGTSSGGGLTLSGHNSLYGLWVRGFSGVQIKAPVGSATLMQCVRASKL